MVAGRSRIRFRVGFSRMAQKEKRWNHGFELAEALSFIDFAQQSLISHAQNSRRIVDAQSTNNRKMEGVGN